MAKHRLANAFFVKHSLYKMRIVPNKKKYKRKLKRKLNLLPD